jgi:hypothetical protein
LQKRSSGFLIIVQKISRKENQGAKTQKFDLAFLCGFTLYSFAALREIVKHF